MNLGHFLIEQLKLYGAGHIFGIPGDYTLNFMREIENVWGNVPLKMVEDVVKSVPKWLKAVIEKIKGKQLD